MKNLVAALMAIFVAFNVSAQSPVPEFKKQPMLLKDGKLVKLEKVSAEIKGKVNGMGYGGVSQMLTIEGGTSNVTASSTPEFMIKLDDDTDPESVIYLAKCLEHKKVREVEVSKTGMYGGGKSVKRFHVKLDFEKVSGGVFKIKLSEKLEEGEYAFVSTGGGASGTMTMSYCFNVGGK